MPEPLNDKERQVLDLLITQAGGVNRPVRFGDLRKARFPELVADIYQAHTDYLDSLASRLLQILDRKGWITVKQAVNTVLYSPRSD
ncbi:MAG: hypothetical protein H7A46_13570 [Verrucomicrobiales bacterium]|nr:hypothetical protein [Verrucomicrobiales bacterium]